MSKSASLQSSTRVRELRRPHAQPSRSVPTASLGLRDDAHQCLKVQPYVRQERDMLRHPVHAILPNGALRVQGAELSAEDLVEALNLLLGPSDACRHHEWREACLIDVHRVLDDGEVHKRQLEDVLREIAFEDALPETRTRMLARRSDVQGRVLYRARLATMLPRAFRYASLAVSSKPSRTSQATFLCVAFMNECVSTSCLVIRLASL